MVASTIRIVFAPLALLIAFAAPPGSAQAPRTFVASYGVDANPCTLVAPCRTFNTAIPKVVPGGEVIALDSAGYGPATVAQSVSIIAPAGVYAGIAVFAGANGIEINAPGAKVVLQNLVINGVRAPPAPAGDFGILLSDAAEVYVDHCTISNMSSAGIRSVAAGSKLYVKDSLIRDNAGPVGWGAFIGAGAMAAFDRTRIAGNLFEGIRAVDAASVVLRRSILAGNNGGLYASASVGTTVVTVEDSLIADNRFDGVATWSDAGALVAVSAAHNTITRNGRAGVGVLYGYPGSGIASLTDNLISQQGMDGVMADGAGAVVTANGNTFAGNGTSALRAVNGATIHTVKGADGLPNNSGEQTTPIIGNVVPASAF